MGPKLLGAGPTQQGGVGAPANWRRGAKVGWEVLVFDLVEEI